LPVGRDSGPAVAVSAVLATQRDRDAWVLVRWCWPPTTSFAGLRISTSVPPRCRSRRGGTDRHLRHRANQPTYPATNYGYIRPGEKLNAESVRAVEAFIEKPDAEIAATYVAERYLWNSGNFLFHVATKLGEIERFEPSIAEAEQCLPLWSASTMSSSSPRRMPCWLRRAQRPSK
jgi:mannose-1-phosphate guanylyltransferase / mannose-6-phosphate isomerase